MLSFDNVSLRRGQRVLFAGAQAQIHPGQKVGVTGANGCGKSSLFSLVLGHLQTDEGHCNIPSDWVIAHVDQEAPHGPRSALDYTLAGDHELVEVNARLKEAEAAADGTRQASLLARLEAIDGYTANSRAAALLHGLGFNNDDLQRALDTFSGGWRVRLSLAQALMCRSDLLLLDEPTNHLDLDAVLWLEQWLLAYRGTLLLVSHDRDFLDAVSGHILNIENQRADLYTGNYSAFELLRAQRLAGQQAAFEKQQREIAHMRSYVDRFRAQATKARQAQSRLKALARMEQIAPAHIDSPFHFSFRVPDKLPAPILKLDEVAGGYGDTRVLDDVMVSLAPGDRIGLLGPNGAGKSTLIKLMAGHVEPQAGQRLPAKTARIGYFAQHQIELLDPQHSPLEHLMQIDGKAREQELRNFLGGFGFANEQAMAPVAPFSGGEKSRLALALLVYRNPNLLLLDEPTNHLDLEMRQALSVALQDFAGAMVIVSHDRHLLRLTVDELWLVDAGRVREFKQSLDDYPRWLSDRQRAARPARDEEDNDNSASKRRDRKRRQAEARQQLAPLRKRLVAAERLIDKLAAVSAELEATLAGTDIYLTKNKQSLLETLQRKADIDAQANRAENDWLEAGQALEAMQGDFDD